MQSFKKPLLDPESVGAEEPKWHRNATMVLSAGFIIAVIQSFSLGALFDIFLFDLKGSNGFVGVVESCRGLTALFAAIPLGLVGDKFNRRKVLIYTVGLGVFSLITLTLSILTNHVTGIFICISLWALTNQSMMANLSAILADSLPSGPTRVKAFTYYTVSSCLGLSFGPLAQMGMMAYCGNTWNPITVRNVMLLGLLSYIPMVFVITSMECVHALKEKIADAALKPWSQDRVCGVKKQWLVPIIIQIGNFILAIGAGMTVKFFPLFFKQEYDLSPTSLNAVLFAFPLSLAILSVILRNVGEKIGRAPACMIFQMIGTAGLFALSMSKPLELTVILFVVRGAFMNAVNPINASLIMDCVDPSHRGRWSSVQSLSMATWAGSAALGGWLADSHSYRFTFLITAIIYCIATLSYVPVLFLVPREVNKE